MSNSSENPPLTKREKQERKLKEKVNHLFRVIDWAGKDKEDFLRLHGESTPSTKTLSRLAKVVLDNKYPYTNTMGSEAQAIRPVVAQGLSFALEGDGIKDSANRYSYYMAYYDSTQEYISERNPYLTETELIKITADRVLSSEEEFRDRLQSDLETLHGLGRGTRIDIDITESKEKIIASLRNQADAVGMGDDFTALRHVYAHGREMPTEEREGLHRVAAYHNSMGRTIKEGKVVNFLSKKNNTEVEVQFERSILAGKFAIYTPTILSREAGVIAPTTYRKETKEDHGPEF
ncbi:hypothetical protein ABZ635_19195 [Nocardiopsis sp. NPDC007018]|uniref:hypothetical protein n=1 Tax=Nocardiopsis sp. NPDC007018 TaxID=3155721 RepID=UPI0033DDCF2C